MSTDKFFVSKNITVTGSMAGGGTELFVSNPRKTIDYFAHEIDRFASAAFESLMIEGPGARFPRSIGWVVIRGYYAAFFAMHALVRLHGWSCTRLTSTPVAFLNREIKLFHPESERMSAGLHFLQVGNGGSEITCRKMDSAQGGSHEQLWTLLDPYMKAVTDLLLSQEDGVDEYQALALAIDGFGKLVKKRGGAQWFTQVRNRVNYSHQYGAWYPYISSSCDVARVTNALDNWLQRPAEFEFDLNQKSDELIQFSTACAFIVALCRTTMDDLVYRSKINSPFRLSSGRLLTMAEAG